MPYIPEESRTPDLIPSSPGELNYCLTRLCVAYWNAHGDYRSINDIVGALECAKLEMYRRVAVPYEDGKIAQNGDVYQ